MQGDPNDDPQRIGGVDPGAADPPMRVVFDAQARKWGAPLFAHLLHARRPSIFRAVQAMWAGLASSGLLPAALHALVCRRVAALNHCPF